MSFSFGTNPTSNSGGTGMTFGAPATSSAFGAPATSSAFGAPATSSAFGAPATSSAFGAPATSSAFGAPSATPGFGTSTSAAPNTFGGGSLFGTSTGAAPSLNLTTGGTSFGAAPASSAAPAQGSFSFGAPSSTPAFSFGNPKPATSVVGVAPTSTTGAFGTTGLGGTVSSTGGFGFPSAAPNVTSTPAGALSGGCVASGPKGSMTFEELEKKCNEWKKELEFQEEAFLKRATQINAWDRLITANAEKITELHEYMKKVKSDQDRMDREIDFVVAQQKELEEMLGPLEQEALALEPTSIQHHTDFERQTTYNSATTVNAQLRGMAERIKDIIEHINANNKSGNDSSSVSQITKILNAHVDVLQFIQNGIDTLQQKTEDVSKLMASGRI